MLCGARYKRRCSLYEIKYFRLQQPKRRTERSECSLVVAMASSENLLFRVMSCGEVTVQLKHLKPGSAQAGKRKFP